MIWSSSKEIYQIWVCTALWCFCIL